MQCPAVFGDSDIHTLDWYYKVSNGNFNAYRCTFDEKEIDLTNDPFYALRDQEARGFITVVCQPQTSSTPSK